jgi:hypothetical protein
VLRILQRLLETLLQLQRLQETLLQQLVAR